MTKNTLPEFKEKYSVTIVTCLKVFLENVQKKYLKGGGDWKKKHNYKASFL